MLKALLVLQFKMQQIPLPILNEHLKRLQFGAVITAMRYRQKAGDKAVVEINQLLGLGIQVGLRFTHLMILSCSQQIIERILSLIRHTHIDIIGFISKGRINNYSLQNLIFYRLVIISAVWLAMHLIQLLRRLQTMAVLAVAKTSAVLSARFVQAALKTVSIQAR